MEDVDLLADIEHKYVFRYSIILSVILLLNVSLESQLFVFDKNTLRSMRDMKRCT